MSWCPPYIFVAAAIVDHLLQRCSQVRLVEIRERVIEPLIDYVAGDRGNDHSLDPTVVGHAPAAGGRRGRSGAVCACCFRGGAEAGVGSGTGRGGGLRVGTQSLRS